MHWFWLRFGFVGTDCQGFRATSAPWTPYIITLSGGILNFQLGTCWVCGGRCRDHGDASHGFPVQGWFLLSQPGTWQCDSDSGQWRLMSDSYPRADGLGPTSGLSLNFFPGIVAWDFSQSPCCLRRLLILPSTSVLLSSPGTQGSHVNGLHFKHISTPFFHVPQDLTQGQGLAENAMLSCVLSWLN